MEAGPPVLVVIRLAVCKAKALPFSLCIVRWPNQFICALVVFESRFSAGMVKPISMIFGNGMVEF